MMRLNTETKTVVYCNCSCSEELDRTLPEMKAHLLNDHKIDVSKTKGTQTMTLHLDAAKYCTSTYECVIGGVKFWKFSTTTYGKKLQRKPTK